MSVTDKKKDLFTERLASLLLSQCGVSEFKEEVKLPASIKDILTSKKYLENKRFKQK